MYFRRVENFSALLREPAAASVTRRSFLQFTTMAGAGLTLGALLPTSADAAAGTGAAAKAAGSAAASSLASPFVRISPDNTVTLICKHVEAGQGVWTGLSAVLAEELDASWSQMRAEGAPAKVPTYGNVAFDPRGSVQGTGGSTSMASSWQQLREAGATARAMLVSAAAQRWSVPAADITVAGRHRFAFVRQARHVWRARERRGAAAGAEGREVQGPEPSTNSSVATSCRDSTVVRKSTGTQQFAIDVSLPGMMTAVVLRPPKFGAQGALDRRRGGEGRAGRRGCRADSARRGCGGAGHVGGEERP